MWKLVPIIPPDTYNATCQLLITTHQRLPNPNSQSPITLKTLTPSPQTMPHCLSLVLLSIFLSIFLIFIFEIESWAENLMELLWFWGGLVHFFILDPHVLGLKSSFGFWGFGFLCSWSCFIFQFGCFCCWSSLQSLLLSFRWSSVWVHCSIYYLYVYF